MKSIKPIFALLLLGLLFISCEAEDLTELTANVTADTSVYAATIPNSPQRSDGDDDMPDPENG